MQRYTVWLAENPNDMQDRYCQKSVQIKDVSEDEIELFLGIAQSGLCTVMISKVKDEN